MQSYRAQELLSLICFARSAPTKASVSANEILASCSPAAAFEDGV